ncbi:hypothetical protein J437_LFUL017564 [Ladona fulva]|uniref:Amine oxidase domain-containing protein n=1 Tax=Ladona fulva TaxID=123851 RepID=A0A8K0PBH3_LADFU|nr:hypothetical protein J437_LFUL017564 [Ladona fulva]
MKWNKYYEINLFSCVKHFIYEMPFQGKYSNPQHELPFRSKIQLKKEVVSVQWDDLNDDERRDKVSITCADGSEYIADHVIITVSLGVLKERINMFHPELPMNKSNAIKGLGIGTVDKIYLRYFHRWWPQDSAGFSLVWNDEGAIAFKKELVNNHMEDQDWLFDVFGFYSVDNHPLILCGWVVGSSAKKMEQISSELVASGCNLLLNFFLSRLYSVPETAEVKRSDWFTNPHFRGSYSLRTMETEKMGTSAEHLSHPVFNKEGKMVLQFAGEATHPHYFSTVHGAVESGWREADRSVKYLR